MALDAGIGANSASDSYDIPYSLKLDASSAEYLLSEGRTQGDSQQKWTYSTGTSQLEIIS